MDEDEIILEAQDLQKLAKKAGVTTPVYAARVVGNRVELIILGGAVVQVPGKASAQATAPENPTPPNLLDAYTLDQLRQVASALGLVNYSSYKKAELIAQLQASYTADQLATALE